jgi:hypothetical protein
LPDSLFETDYPSRLIRLDKTGQIAENVVPYVLSGCAGTQRMGADVHYDSVHNMILHTT